MERWGFEDPACGEKRSLQHWSEKKRKKEKKLIFTYMPANEAMAAVGLAGLEGRGMVKRWGFEDPACGGEEVSATVRKEMKKRKKKHNFTYVPVNEAMVAAGLARLEGRGTVERWGFEDPACGEKRSLQWSEKK